MKLYLYLFTVFLLFVDFLPDLVFHVYFTTVFT